MATDVDFVRGMVANARRMFVENTKALTLEEALFAGGGYRSVLGVMKHIGGWAQVYRSYAFDETPRHWAQTAWPQGRIDTVDATQEYFDEVVAWTEAGLKAWDEALARVEAGTLDQPRPMHWGGTLPLAAITVLVAHHVVYHTGELNMLLSIKKGEAWEYTEEVEENHISTFGHGTRAPWMTDAQNDAYEEKLRLAHEARRPHASVPSPEFAGEGEAG